MVHNEVDWKVSGYLLGTIEIDTFTIHLNDLDEMTKCNISKFTNNMKFSEVVSCVKDAKRLDLNKLSE